MNERHVQVKTALRSIDLPNGISIRAWEETDFPAIQQLSSAEGWPAPQNRPGEAKAAWCASWPTLVITEKEEIIGFLRAITDGNITTYIAEILIVPERRGRQFGKILVEVCHRLCPSTRLDLLSIESSDSFYEAIGFRRFQGFRKSFR